MNIELWFQKYFGIYYVWALSMCTFKISFFSLSILQSLQFSSFLMMCPNVCFQCVTSTLPQQILNWFHLSNCLCPKCLSNPANSPKHPIQYIQAIANIATKTIHFKSSKSWPKTHFRTLYSLHNTILYLLYYYITIFTACTTQGVFLIIYCVNNNCVIYILGWWQR